MDKGGSRSPKKVDPPEADSSAKSGSAATAPPQNLQTAIAGVNVGGDFSATVNQTINYNQVLQDAKHIGIPLNLPQTNVTFFAGRDDDLQKVHELLQKNQKVAVSAFVKGMGGVGKSELALQYALRHLLTDYGGGICWLRGNEGTLPTQLQDFVQVQLRETMPDGLDSGEKLAGYCWRRLSERIEGQMLVVLDDVKDYGNVEPFLPTLDGKFRVLVTTRLGWGNAMQQYTLDVLVLAAAVDLLKSFLPEADPRQENEEAIENLCTWLGRLPLAIELVGRYLALPNQLDTGISEILQRLRGECMVQLSQITVEERKLLPKNLNVAASFFLSWQELSPLAQRLACLLGLFALAPIPWTLIQSAMLNETKQKQSFWQGLQGLFQKKAVALTERDLQGARGELLNLHLLERTQQGVYELHQLLREYFQFQLQQHPEWQVLRQQVAVSLLNISKGVGQTITIDQVKEVTPAIPHLEILGQEMLDVIPNPEDNLVWAFVGIARFYEGQGLYASAVIPFQNCLNETESRLGSDHPSVATSLNNLAGLYNSQGKYREAELLFVQSLEIIERQLGENHPDVATIINNLAESYKSQGKYSEAETLYLRSLEIWECKLGENHPKVAAILNNLADLYKSQGRYSESETLYLRSLEIRERKQGSIDPDVAQSLNNLALLYRVQGKYCEAETLYLRSLEIWECKLGENHPKVAASLNNLAELYRIQGRYSEAEILRSRCLGIERDTLGEEHPQFAASLNNLAYLYELQGKYSEAETLYQRSLKIREWKLGTDHLDVAQSLNNIALLYYTQGKYEEVEPLNRRSLSIRERQLGVDHPDVSTSLNNLALLYYSQGKYSETEPLYMRSLEIRERQLGADHPDVAQSLLNLAALYHNTQRHPKALQSIQRAIQIYEQKLGTEHPNTQNALRWLQTIREASL